MVSFFQFVLMCDFSLCFTENVIPEVEAQGSVIFVF